MLHVFLRVCEFFSEVLYHIIAYLVPSHFHSRKSTPTSKLHDSLTKSTSFFRFHKDELFFSNFHPAPSPAKNKAERNLFRQLKVERLEVKPYVVSPSWPGPCYPQRITPCFSKKWRTRRTLHFNFGLIGPAL